MGRRYTQKFSGVSVSAAQDLVFLPGSPGKMLRIIRQWVDYTDTTLIAGQMLQLRSRALPATVTAGSGGTTGATPSKVDQGDATCSTTTAGTNNTTKATTSGTAVVLYEGGCHLYEGHDRYFDSKPPIGPTEAFVFELLSVPSAAVHLSGGVEFEEIGG